LPDRGRRPPLGSIGRCPGRGGAVRLFGYEMV
jgi:hypothetical protein